MEHTVIVDQRGEGIVLIGPLPPPYGGVSTFLERLALAVPSIIRMILDTGTGSPRRSRTLRVDVRSLPPGTVRSWRALRKELRGLAPPTTVVVNVSHPQGVLRYLPAFASALSTVVVLHHGAPLRRSGPIGWIIERVTRYVLRTRTTVVLCLNQSQAQFIRDVYGVPQASIRFASSYVPVDLVLDELDEVRTTAGKPRVVASGVARGYHHFDRLVEVWNASGFGEEADLVICLYGPDNTALESALAAAARKTEGVTLHRDLDGWEFLDLLRASDVYVRASSVDSFGIAVADAVRLGLEVVATDVCQRYPGCRLIPPDDPAALREALRQAIWARRSFGGRPRPAIHSDATKISLLDALGIDYRDSIISREGAET